MSWDNFKNIKTGSGDILKLEDGKPYKLRIIGEPYVYESEYQGQSSIRFALTVYNQTDNKAQIVMLPKSAVGQIYELVEDEAWGSPEDYDIVIKRTGTGKDTVYSIVPQPKKKLESDKQNEVESIVLDEVLSRLPSVGKAFPLSEVNDMDKLIPNKKTEPKKVPDDVVIEEIPDEEVNLDEIPF